MERGVQIHNRLLNFFVAEALGFQGLHFAKNRYLLSRNIFLVNGTRHDPVHHGDERVKQEQHPANPRHIEEKVSTSRTPGVQVGSQRGQPRSDGGSYVFPHHNSGSDLEIDPTVYGHDDRDPHCGRGRLNKKRQDDPYSEKDQNGSESETVQLLDQGLYVLNEELIGRFGTLE